MPLLDYFKCCQKKVMETPPAPQMKTRTLYVRETLHVRMPTEGEEEFLREPKPPVTPIQVPKPIDEDLLEARPPAYEMVKTVKFKQ